VSRWLLCPAAAVVVADDHYPELLLRGFRTIMCRPGVQVDIQRPSLQDWFCK
jgi:hypothetical protein